MVNKIKQLGPPKQAVKQKKEVDGDGEKPHNLTSSLPMNTTLHHPQQAVPNKFFNN
jgi:hypothetical protein